VIGFYTRDEKCLQRGTDWVFIYKAALHTFKALSLAVKENLLLLAEETDERFTNCNIP
jgi:hypothetical protein